MSSVLARYPQAISMNLTSTITSPSTKPIGQFDRSLIKVLGHEACRDEIRYRVQKLRNCLAIAEDKFFLKTPKAREQLRICIDIADRLSLVIGSGDHNEFAIITALEMTFNDLLKKTYEFRVKAG
jgi:hypothetical protein